MNLEEKTATELLRSRIFRKRKSGLGLLLEDLTIAFAENSFLIEAISTLFYIHFGPLTYKLIDIDRVGVRFVRKTSRANASPNFLRISWTIV